MGREDVKHSIGMLSRGKIDGAFAATHYMLMQLHFSFDLLTIIKISQCDTCQLKTNGIDLYVNTR